MGFTDHFGFVSFNQISFFFILLKIENEFGDRDAEHLAAGIQVYSFCVI